MLFSTGTFFFLETNSVQLRLRRGKKAKVLNLCTVCGNPLISFSDTSAFVSHQTFVSFYTLTLIFKSKLYLSLGILWLVCKGVYSEECRIIKSFRMEENPITVGGVLSTFKVLPNLFLYLNSTCPIRAPSYFFRLPQLTLRTLFFDQQLQCL